MFNSFKTYEKTWGTVDWTKQDYPLNTIQTLLAKGAKINKRGPNRSTILMQIIKAHKKGWEQAAAFLIQKGSRVNAHDKQGLTPLMMTARHKDGRGIAALLLKHGAFINATSKASADRPITTFPLMEAVTAANPELVSLLCQCGANVHQQNNQGDFVINMLPGHNDQFFKENAKIVDILQQRGANLASQANPSANTPLMTAAFCGNVELFKHIHRRGASLNDDTAQAGKHVRLNGAYADLPARTTLSTAILAAQPEIVAYSLQNEAEQTWHSELALNGLLHSSVPGRIQQEIAALMDTNGREHYSRNIIRRMLRQAALKQRRSLATRLSKGTNSRNKQAILLRECRRKQKAALRESQRTIQALRQDFYLHTK